MNLQSKLYTTVHGSDRSVEQVADELGISTSYLYKAAQEDSGCRFPLELLIPLMRATRDERVLDHLCHRMDSVRVKLKRVRKLKHCDATAVNQVQQRFSAAMSLVLQFLEDPDPKELPAVVEALRTHLADAASLERAVRDYQQGEIFDDDE